jgi:hypothetical protein
MGATATAGAITITGTDATQGKAITLTQVDKVPELPTPIEPTFTLTAPRFAATFKNAPFVADALYVVLQKQLQLKFFLF